MNYKKVVLAICLVPPGMISSDNNEERIKELEEENSRLKKMYANLSLVHEAFKDAVAKKL